MQYLYVKWIHDFEDEPFELYSELNEERFETRKIEIYKNGSIGYASTVIAKSGTKLGLVPIPELAEILQDPQFNGKEIKQNEFETLWNSIVVDCRSPK